jgi:hypothetical protein
MRFKCVGCEEIKEIEDSEIQKILDMHVEERKKKEINSNALQEVAKAVAVLEEQLNVLKTNVEDLNSKIKESDSRINEAVIVS